MALLVQVCRQWRQTAGANLAALRPVKPKLHLLAHIAPGITSLDLSGNESYYLPHAWARTVRLRCCGCRSHASGMPVLPTGCRSVRNRNLAVLPHTASRLQRLVIGHPERSAGIRPSITNEVPLVQLGKPWLCSFGTVNVHMHQTNTLVGGLHITVTYETQQCAARRGWPASRS